MERKNTSVKKEFVNALASFVSYDDFVEDIVSILMSLRSDKNDADKYEQLADAVEAYLIQNYNKNITSDILSKEFGFVPSYISRLFKRQKGVSPNEYITKYRIEMAKKLKEADVQHVLIDPLAEHGEVKPHCFVANERVDPVAEEAFQRLAEFLKEKTK